MKDFIIQLISSVFIYIVAFYLASLFCPYLISKAISFFTVVAWLILINVGEESNGNES